MVNVLFYREDDRVPALDFILEQERRVQSKCIRAVERLEELGHLALENRNHAAYLRDEIYELRVRDGHVNYRLLFCFHGQEAVLLTSGITKTDVVPPAEIDRAIVRRNRFIANPDRHCVSWED